MGTGAATLPQKCHGSAASAIGNAEDKDWADPVHPRRRLNQQMAVGRRGVDTPGLQALEIAGILGSQRPGTAQDRTRDTGRIGGGVEHCTDWRRILRRQARHELAERLEATRRRTDHHNRLVAIEARLCSNVR